MCFVSFSTAAGSSNLLPTRELVVSQSIISVWMCEHVLLEQKGKVVNALLYVNTVVLLTVIVRPGPFREIWGPGTKINLGAPSHFVLDFEIIKTLPLICRCF